MEDALALSRRDLLTGTGKVILVGTALTGVALMVEGCNTSWVQVAINDLPTVINIATSIAGIVALAQSKGTVTAAVSNAIATVTTTIKNGLTSVEGLITSFKNAAASAQAGIVGDIDAGLTALQQNLNTILSTFHVDDVALQATISTGVSLALAAISAVQLLLPVVTPTQTPPAVAARVAPRIAARKAMQAQVTNQIVLPQKEQLRAMYNAVAVFNGYSAYQAA